MAHQSHGHHNLQLLNASYRFIERKLRQNWNLSATSSGEPTVTVADLFSMAAGRNAQGYRRDGLHLLAKIVDNFSSITTTKFDLNLISQSYQAHQLMRMPRLIDLEYLMSRFYFDLTSNDEHITDDGGRELDSLNDAYEHARKLIDKILLHVGHDDADTWKVIISNDEHDAQMIIPFSVSDVLRTQRRRTS
jgi:Domain of unknown function (DUF6894)